MAQIGAWRTILGLSVYLYAHSIIAVYLSVGAALWRAFVYQLAPVWPWPGFTNSAGTMAPASHTPDAGGGQSARQARQTSRRRQKL